MAYRRQTYRIGRARVSGRILEAARPWTERCRRSVLHSATPGWPRNPRRTMSPEPMQTVDIRWRDAVS